MTQLTEQQRADGFMEDYKQLEQKWGVTFKFDLEGENFNTMFQVKIKPGLALIEGWNPLQEINIPDALSE